MDKYEEELDRLAEEMLEDIKHDWETFGLKSQRECLKMTEWIKCSDRTPDSRNYSVLVYCPNGLYENDMGYPTLHILNWYKSNFGDNHDLIMEKIKFWCEIPAPPACQ
jgi:hypothetical protein